MKLRINKLISDAGMGSRREAEKYITEGRVKINGRIARLSDSVGETDVVLFDDVDLPVKDLIREGISLRNHDEQIFHAAAKKSRQDERKNTPRHKQHKELAPQRDAGRSRTGNKSRSGWDMDEEEDFGYSTGRGFRKGNRKNDNPVKKFRH